MKRIELETRDGYEKVHAISHSLRWSHYVNPISKRQLSDPEVGKVIKALVDLVSDRGMIGYELPSILRDVDPEGLLIPREVAKRLSSTKTTEVVRRLTRIAGAYPLGGPAWRTIAKPVVVRAIRSGIEGERRSLFSSLMDRGSRSWSGTPGEVPELFISEVQSARKKLESETETEFIPFWEWHLEGAEAELRDQEERAKEERGE